MGIAISRLRALETGLFTARFRDVWDRYEGPTWVVASLIYGSWIVLTLNYARLPLWLLIPLAAYVTAWHASLQHETIHALARVPRPIRMLLAWPALGLWLPYALFYRKHIAHHRRATLTEPVDDPETFYHTFRQWSRYGRITRFVLLLNQTMLGRMGIGPALWAFRTAKDESLRMLSGDFSHVRDWLWHAVSVALVLLWVVTIAHMSAWKYIAFFAYPGACLGALRTLVEHRWADDCDRRTAIVESRGLLALLFLNNNFHAVHHLMPSLPWYKIPVVYSEQRSRLLKRNGAYHFTSYGQIARKWFVRPVFVPVKDEAKQER